MTMQRRRIHWAGFIGAPGLTTLYTQAGATLNTAIRAFFNTISVYLPSPITITIDSAGDEIDEATGALTGTWTDTVVSPVTGGTAGAYAGPAGLIVEWRTNGLSAHRRVMGKTFIVPSNQIGTSGQAIPAALSGLQAAAATLVAAAAAPNSLYVWSRPTPANPVGFHSTVVAASVPNKVVVLRSRRD